MTEEQPLVRRSGTWMSIWDDRILEYIAAKGHGSPSQLAESGYIRVSPQHISRRLQKLEDHDLVDHLDNSVYIINDRGRQYLAGEIDTAETDSEE